MSPGTRRHFADYNVPAVIISPKRKLLSLALKKSHTGRSRKESRKGCLRGKKGTFSL